MPVRYVCCCISIYLFPSLLILYTDIPGRKRIFFRLLAIPILQLFSCFSRLIPIYLATFIFSAAFPALIRLSSSRKPISSTQCRLFSIPQCARLFAPYPSAVISSILYRVTDRFCCPVPFCHRCHTCTDTTEARPATVLLEQPVYVA